MSEKRKLPDLPFLEEEPAPPTGGTNPKRPGRLSPVNDLDLTRWREYDDIVTSSLWLIPERDRSGSHLGDYHGNFVPQIPYQAMRRFTKQGEVVLDAFLGSGTTLIECRRLGRHGIGVELKPQLVEAATHRINSENNPHNVTTRVITGDSSDAATRSAISEALQAIGREHVQLVILHPPYHSIIKFSDLSDDLSNCSTVDEFRERFGRVVDVVGPFLDVNRYLVVVIGDMYANSRWIPLGFYCMQEVMRRGYHLKSIVVKDIQNNRAKRNLQNIWHYRALVGGFYIFKHEYVIFFKRGSGAASAAPHGATARRADRTGSRSKT